MIDKQIASYLIKNKFPEKSPFCILEMLLCLTAPCCIYEIDENYTLFMNYERKEKKKKKEDFMDKDDDFKKKIVTFYLEEIAMYTWK